MRFPIRVAYLLGKIAWTVSHRGFEDALDEVNQLIFLVETSIKDHPKLSDKAKVAEVEIQLRSLHSLLRSPVSNQTKEDKADQMIRKVLATL